MAARAWRRAVVARGRGEGVMAAEVGSEAVAWEGVHEAEGVVEAARLEGGAPICLRR